MFSKFISTSVLLIRRRRLLKAAGDAVIECRGPFCLSVILVIVHSSNPIPHRTFTRWLLLCCSVHLGFLDAVSTQQLCHPLWWTAWTSPLVSIPEVSSWELYRTWINLCLVHLEGWVLGSVYLYKSHIWLLHTDYAKWSMPWSRQFPLLPTFLIWKIN